MSGLTSAEYRERSMQLKEAEFGQNTKIQDAELGLKKEKADFDTESAWGSFAGGLAEAVGDMVLNGVKISSETEIAMAENSAKIQITSMQEETKRMAIEADRVVETKKAEVTQKVAEYQKDVEEVRAKAAVAIKKVEAEAGVVIEANKNRSLQIVSAQKMAHEAWLRGSYSNPSPFSA